MSRKKIVSGLLLVAVVGAGLAVWLWKPWAGTYRNPELNAEPVQGEPTSGEKASKGNGPAHSKLFREFESKSLQNACQAHYDHVDGGGSIGAFTINESPDTYKKFNVEGTISGDKLKQLFAAFKADLHKLAKASGVEKVGQPSDKVEDRPISVLRAMFLARRIDPGSVLGFYLTYTDGKVAGAIDVIAVRDSSSLDHWLLVCAIHEVVPQ